MKLCINVELSTPRMNTFYDLRRRIERRVNQREKGTVTILRPDDTNVEVIIENDERLSHEALATARSFYTGLAVGLLEGGGLTVGSYSVSS